MKKLLLLIITFLSYISLQAQNELLYGVYTGTETLKGVGTEKVETYDVAMHLNDPMLAGMELKGMKIPLNVGADITDCQAWLSKELTLKSGKMVADIVTVSFTPDGKWVDVTFPEPYVITEEGVYAGYSFTVASVETTASKKPLMFVACEGLDNFYIHTSRTFRKWRCLAETAYYENGVYGMVVRLGGDRVKERAAIFEAPDELSTFVNINKKTTLTMPLVNHGLADISSIEYELQVGDETIERSANVSLKGTYYGRKTNMKVEMPAMSTSGSREVNIRVTKINGADNEEEQPVTTFNMAYVTEFPKHKPLMEEYTGTWCQWCVVGIAAMEAMNKLYGDEFVGVAFHNGDIMTITSVYPNVVSGFPTAYLDRVQHVSSPFWGTSGTSLGIQEDWKKRENIIAPASLTMEAHWADEAQTQLAVTSTTTFIRDFNNSPYQLSYILTADGLKGEGKQWSQNNGYAGSTDQANDPYLGPFTKKPGLITDIEFNDVAIQLASNKALAIEGTLPNAVSGNVPYQHTYTFDITGNTLVQDKTKLRPVAILIDTRTGEVVNAEKVRVSETTGISTSDNLHVTSNHIYDLSGRKIAHARLSKGVYITNGKKIIK